MAPRTLIAALLAVTTTAVLAGWQTAAPPDPAAARSTHDAIFTAASAGIEPGYIRNVVPKQYGDAMILSPRYPEWRPSKFEDARADAGDRACRSAGVVEGVAVKSKSYLTADGGAIYTEWTVRVSEVLKAPSRGTLTPDAQLLVLRLGGLYEIAGRAVTLPPPPQQKRVEQNNEYLFFFSRWIEKTGGFVNDDVIPFDKNRKDRVKAGAGVESYFEPIARPALRALIKEEVAKQQSNADCQR